MKKIAVFFLSIFFLFILPYCIHFLFYNGLTFNDRFHMQKSYGSLGELFGVLAKCTNINKIFLWCCDCILYIAHLMNMTYEEVNIYIFVIWQPYLIALFAYLFVDQLLINRKLRKQALPTRPLVSRAA